jgi:hypothetical protein
MVYVIAAKVDTLIADYPQLIIVKAAGSPSVRRSEQLPVEGRFGHQQTSLTPAPVSAKCQ